MFEGLNLPSWMLHEKYELVLRALKFAIRAHGDQKRKYTGEPYVVHLIEVADNVYKLYESHGLAAPVYVLQAAILHDTIEDTDASYLEIRDLFGINVAGLVMWVTDTVPKEITNRALRKQLEADRIRFAPHAAKVIKRCDIDSNTASIAQHDPKFAETYLPEKERVLRVIGPITCSLLFFTIKMPYEVTV